jgi:hypothetical protein
VVANSSVGVQSDIFDIIHSDLTESVLTFFLLFFVVRQALAVGQ